MGASLLLIMKKKDVTQKSSDFIEGEIDNSVTICPFVATGQRSALVSGSTIKLKTKQEHQTSSTEKCDDRIECGESSQATECSVCSIVF